MWCRNAQPHGEGQYALFRVRVEWLRDCLRGLGSLKPCSVVMHIVVRLGLCPQRQLIAVCVFWCLYGDRDTVGSASLWSTWTVALNMTHLDHKDYTTHLFLTTQNTPALDHKKHAGLRPQRRQLPPETETIPASYTKEGACFTQQRPYLPHTTKTIPASHNKEGTCLTHQRRHMPHTTKTIPASHNKEDIRFIQEDTCLTHKENTCRKLAFLFSSH